MRLYTTAEVAKITGKDPSTIRGIAIRYEQIGQKFGRDWVFLERDIATIENLRPGPNKEARLPAYVQRPSISLPALGHEIRAGSGPVRLVPTPPDDD